eukprot:scaffold174518_cov31-Tisochrysis_lutea.AAC.3
MTTRRPPLCVACAPPKPPLTRGAWPRAAMCVGLRCFHLLNVFSAPNDEDIFAMIPLRALEHRWIDSLVCWEVVCTGS